MLPDARKDRVLVEKIGDELIVYDQDRDHAHCLNLTTMLVWELCDGQTTVLEIAEALKKKLNVPADERLVWLALDELEKAHLLREPLQLAEDIRAITRRQLIQQLSLVAALAVLMPVVTSISAPSAAMAKSVSPVIDCVRDCGDALEACFKGGGNLECGVSYAACLTYCNTLAK
jgi:hypothetical protein